MLNTSFSLTIQIITLFDSSSFRKCVNIAYEQPVGLITKTELEHVYVCFQKLRNNQSNDLNYDHSPYSFTVSYYIDVKCSTIIYRDLYKFPRENICL